MPWGQAGCRGRRAPVRFRSEGPGCGRLRCRLSARRRQHVEHRGDVAGESLAAGGQGDRPVRAGAQQGGAGGGLELADLAGEDGAPDAELAGCVVKAGLAGEGEEPSDALLGARVGEHVPDVRGERTGSAEGGEWVSAAGDAVPDADAGLAGCGGEDPAQVAGPRDPVREYLQRRHLQPGHLGHAQTAVRLAVITVFTDWSARISSLTC
jgi:hypothetical protein